MQRIAPTADARGESLHLWEVQPGDWVWHLGEFRRITSVEINRGVVRLGKRVIRPGGNSMEVVRR